MKRIIALFVTLIFVATMGITVLAGPGSFVSSPSGQSAPILVEAVNEDENCSAWIKITAYADRDSLPDDGRQEIEEAYNIVVETENLTTLNEALAELAAAKGIPGEYLAVSDLFDVRWEGCEDHQTHGAFKIKFSAETLENFVGLLHLHNGSWHLIENAMVEDETYLTFTASEFSPFAIVVNTNPEADDTDSDTNTDDGVVDPGTGDDITVLRNAIIIAAVAGVVLITVSLIGKKKQEE